MIEICLPAFGEADPPLGTPPAGRRTGILVVDDNPAVCGLVRTTLQLNGFAAWTAGSGPEALDQYQRHRAAVDLVLLDVRMPGLDGPQTLAALRQLDPWLRSCFMTADLASYEYDRLLDLGAAHVFRKPFHVADLVQVLRRLTADATPVAG